VRVLQFDIFVGALEFVGEYLSLHVITCLVPAFFIAGLISSLFSKETVLKYLGSGSKTAYLVAALGGFLLAVCSCTILPLFGSIYKRGAGIGPATTFLFSGPAINVLAIVYTARALGIELGVARAITAILFSILIGIVMSALFERERKVEWDVGEYEEDKKVGIIFALLVLILLVGGAIGESLEEVVSTTAVILLMVILITITAYLSMRWFSREDIGGWMRETAFLTRMIFPPLLIGIFLMGIIVQILPPDAIARWLGGGLLSVSIASVVSTVMYFATLVEVPIVGGLMVLGMGSGPALAMLLSGPAVSLPNMLVIYRIMGGKRTGAYISLVIVVSIISGVLYGLMRM
jgi:hypothetical protein